jgi:hypothetical protein
VRRIFWLATGLGAGATGAFLFSRWFQKQANRLAPPNLVREAARALSGVVSELNGSVAEFRLGMAERETELRSAE